MPKKHLILIHGRATKPSNSEKLRLVRKSLLHGLDREHSSAADLIRDQTVRFSFVYYGDISNRMMIEKDPDIKDQLTDVDDQHEDAPCELAGSYDESLKKLFDQKAFTKKAYNKHLDDNPDQRYMDELAGALSWIAGLAGLSDNVVRIATADMGAYLMTRKIGSAVRERLQGPLKKALLTGEDICIVSHSMGCIVTYDVLWKFSQMSEYRDVQDSGNRVKLWLTLGDPLGEPGVKKNLYDADEASEDKHPKNIIQNWMNISARDDFVSHDSRIADDYAKMKEMKYLKSLKDKVNIYNFWVGTAGTNPHKLYGYLDNPVVAGQIANWIENS